MSRTDQKVLFDSLVNGNKLKVDGRVVSSLIRDFIFLLEYDLDILRYDQTKCVLSSKPDLAVSNSLASYLSSSLSSYLVVYRKDINPAKQWPNIIYEVRSRKEIFDNWQILKPYFQAIRKFAKAQGWKFQIITEQEIRTAYLENVKFLFRYRSYSPTWEEYEFLLDKLVDMREADPESLLQACYKDWMDRVKLIPVLWHLVSVEMIKTDLRLPLSMRSRVWAARSY